MKKFEHYPDGIKCPLCGTSDDKECTLIPIDNTQVEKICKAVPVHVDCIMEGDFHFNREVNILYINGREK